MKRFNFLLVVVVLLVTAVSCTTMTRTQDGYYDQQAGVYGPTVLQRDPWSGRFYGANPYGSYYGNRYYGGGYNMNRRNNAYYNRGNNNVYSNRGNKNYQAHTQQPAPVQRGRSSDNRNEARRKVLGN